MQLKQLGVVYWSLSIPWKFSNHFGLSVLRILLGIEKSLNKYMLNEHITDNNKWLGLKGRKRGMSIYCQSRLPVKGNAWAWRMSRNELSEGQGVGERGAKRTDDGGERFVWTCFFNPGFLEVFIMLIHTVTLQSQCGHSFKILNHGILFLWSIF